MEFIKIKDKSPWVLKEIEQYHPDSPRHTTYWRSLKKLAIEGCWGEDFNNEFRFMPPKLWYYLNFGLIQDEDKKTKARREIRPKIADVMWELAYACLEARGFSGFILDTNNTADRAIFKFSKSSTPVSNLDTSLYFKPGGTFKDYIDPRTYLRSRHKQPFGCPLYSNPSQNIMILGARGGGKATTYESKVYNLEGESTIGQLKVGDKIFGSNGKLCSVKAIHPQGITDVYRVTFADGRFLDTHPDHLWEVFTWSKNNNSKVVSTLQIFNDKYKHLHKRSGYTYKYSVKQTLPVEYEEKNLPINPYILGCLLGDGTMTTVAPKIASSDQEILDYFNHNLEVGYQVKYDKSTTNNHTLCYFGAKKRLVGKGQGRHLHSYNPLHDEIKKLGLNVKCKDKFIPNDYLYSSIEQRLELLRGLMDTDGSINTEYSCEFTNTNKRLVEQTAQLCRSLGIRCKIKLEKGGYESNIKGHKFIAKDIWRLFINTSKPIFKLSRKLNRLKPNSTTRELQVAITNIEKIEPKETICITVDSKDNCYLSNDYLVTHNSFYVANELHHEVLFDGMKEYTQDAIDNPTKVEVFLGAAIASKSTETSQKILAAHNALAIKREFGAWGELHDSDYEPSPFYKDMTGDIGPNNMKSPWRYEYEEKVNGRWVTSGTGSVLKHNIYTTENPQAAAGGRYTIMFDEEVGLHPNVIVSHWSNEACMRLGTRKFGSAIYAGTAGDMEKILEAQEMFENPEDYNMLSYPNDWEGNPNKQIGFFLPAYYTDFSFKDEHGNTDLLNAKAHYEQLHADKRKAKNSAAYEGELMNAPTIPAHMFIKKTGNLLPIAEIDEQLRHLEFTESYKQLETPVTLLFDSTEPTGVGYRPDTKGELKPITDFPLSSNHSDREGCVLIYEFPKIDPNTGRPYEGLYLIGHDPVKNNDDLGPSLAGIYVMKTNKYKFNHGHNEIVASYIGRPYEGHEKINEILEKLAMFYGASNRMIWFERNVGETKPYFEKKQKLNLLALEPRLTFTNTHTKGGPRLVYGYNIQNQHDKLDALQYLRTWLLRPHTTYEDGRVELNLNKIQDRALLKEMKAYNFEDNFDRVSTLFGCIIGLEETHNQFKEALTKKETSINHTINFFKEKGRKLLDLPDEFPTTQTKNSIQQEGQDMEKTKYRLPVFPG